MIIERDDDDFRLEYPDSEGEFLLPDIVPDKGRDFLKQKPLQEINMGSVTVRMFAIEGNKRPGIQSSKGVAVQIAFNEKLELPADLFKGSIPGKKPGTVVLTYQEAMSQGRDDERAREHISLYRDGARQMAQTISASLRKMTPGHAFTVEDKTHEVDWSSIAEEAMQTPKTLDVLSTNSSISADTVMRAVLGTLRNIQNNSLEGFKGGVAEYLAGKEKNQKNPKEGMAK